MGTGNSVPIFPIFPIFPYLTNALRLSLISWA
jgi:hypothetical protein